MNMQQKEPLRQGTSGFLFYRIPKALMDSGLSLDAAVLYSLLLDRLKLSVRNHWADQRGRVYVYFTLDEVQKQIRCGHNKATALMRELEGARLIERVRQGLGKPARIYVERFRERERAGQAEPIKEAAPKPREIVPEGPATEGRKEETGTGTMCEGPAENRQKGAARKDTGSGSRKTTESVETAEGLFFSARRQAVQRDRQGASRLPESVPPECREQAAIKTEKKKTEFIKIDPSIPPAPHTLGSPSVHRGNRMDEIGWIQKEIRYHIDYDGLLRDYPYEAELFDGYVSLMAEACCTNRDSLRICGEEVPAGLVRRRLLSLDRAHILYVRDCLSNVTSRIANIKAYTLAALYNAPVTIAQYYDALVSRDFTQKD